MRAVRQRLLRLRVKGGLVGCSRAGPFCVGKQTSTNTNQMRRLNLCVGMGRSMEGFGFAEILDVSSQDDGT
ncbi:hypothetical protein AAMO2058_000500600 [Amorphochlora amoebiformis]